MGNLLVALSVLGIASATDDCYTQSWEACSCDALECANSEACLAPCNEKQESPACRALSKNCDQYDNLVCGSWCTDQRGGNVTCSSCRAEECEPYCHGDPSVCKFDLCPVNAAACGDGWAFACQNFSAIAPEDTKRALADPATQRFTPASIAGALETWNARMRASGADCDCSAYDGGEHAEPFCKKSDLCAAVEGILDPTPPERSESAWDGRCCAYCVLASEQGECGLWSPTRHYGHILERVLPLLSEL